MTVAITALREFCLRYDAQHPFDDPVDAAQAVLHYIAQQATDHDADLFAVMRETLAIKPEHWERDVLAPLGRLAVAAFRYACQQQGLPTADATEVLTEAGRTAFLLWLWDASRLPVSFAPPASAPRKPRRPKPTWGVLDDSGLPDAPDEDIPDA